MRSRQKETIAFFIQKALTNEEIYCIIVLTQ